MCVKINSNLTSKDKNPKILTEPSVEVNSHNKPHTFLVGIALLISRKLFWKTKFLYVLTITEGRMYDIAEK